MRAGPLPPGGQGWARPAWRGTQGPRLRGPATSPTSAALPSAAIFSERPSRLPFHVHPTLPSDYLYPPQCPCPSGSAGRIDTRSSAVPRREQRMQYRTAGGVSCLARAAADPWSPVTSLASCTCHLPYLPHSVLLTCTPHSARQCG